MRQKILDLAENCRKTWKPTPNIISLTLRVGKLQVKNADGETRTRKG
ncbi:MAG: hypothetical protein ACKOQS_19875 [Dolichospermum sp.]